MPLDQRNSITAKATGLIFSLFEIASAREVPFGIPQYVQCILQGLTIVLHSSSLTVKSVNLVVGCDGFLCVTRKHLVFFIVATFITEVLFEHFLIHTAA